MMVKAHVSPGFRAKIKPQTEQRSRWDHPENSGPSPQCGQRLRSPRRSAVPIDFERNDRMLELRSFSDLTIRAILDLRTGAMERTPEGGAHQSCNFRIANSKLVTGA